MIDWNKIQVVPTQKERQSEYIFPKEGWFVGATNQQWGKDHFEAHYLYEPQWSTHNKVSWGGYFFRNKDGEPEYWWTFNCCFSNIETSFLYVCEDQETAKNLADILNLIPSKSILRLKDGIRDLEEQIKFLQEKKKKLESLDKYVKYLIC